MDNFIDALTRGERRTLEQMALASNATLSEMALQSLKGFLVLAKEAPDAVPNNPLTRLSADNYRKGL